MRLGIDCDDVLNTWVKSFLDWHNVLYQTRFLLYQVSPNHDFPRQLGLTKEEAYRRFHAFNGSENHANMDAEVGVEIVVPQLATKHDLIMVSARPSTHIDLIKKWLRGKGLEDYFKGYCFTGHLANPHDSLTKGQVCREEGIDLMVDDSPFNLMHCLEAQVGVIAYCRPWNEGLILPAARGLSVPRARSWFDVEQIVESYK